MRTNRPIHISTDLHMRIKHAAADLETSVKALVTDAIMRHLDALEEAGKVTSWESIQALGPQRTQD